MADVSAVAAAAAAMLICMQITGARLSWVENRVWTDKTWRILHDAPQAGNCSP